MGAWFCRYGNVFQSLWEIGSTTEGRGGTRMLLILSLLYGQPYSSIIGTVMDKRHTDKLSISGIIAIVMKYLQNPFFLCNSLLIILSL